MTSSDKPQTLVEYCHDLLDRIEDLRSNPLEAPILIQELGTVTHQKYPSVDTILVTELPLDPQVIQGLFARYEKQSNVYKNEVTIVEIFVSSFLTREEQNFVIAKELMHVGHVADARTNKTVEIQELMLALSHGRGEDISKLDVRIDLMAVEGARICLLPTRLLLKYSPNTEPELLADEFSVPVREARLALHMRKSEFDEDTA